VVVVVVADVTAAKINDTQSTAANCRKRFQIINNHLWYKSMNFRITPYCNEAVTECKKKTTSGSQNETPAALGIVACFDTAAPLK